MELSEFNTNSTTFIKNGLPMVKRDLVFIDLETTGLRIDHEITEIGWLRVDPKTLEILESENIKIKPTNLELADKKALEITNYSEENWSDAISIEEAMKIFISRNQGCVLVGYNFFYDWAWLYRTLNQLGAANPPFYYHKLDVLSMAYILLKDLPNIENFSLNNICDFFNIKRENAHNAFYDAKFTFEIYKKLLNYINEHKI